MAWLVFGEGGANEATRNVGPSVGDGGQACSLVALSEYSCSTGAYRTGYLGRGPLGLPVRGLQGHDLEGWLDDANHSDLRRRVHLVSRTLLHLRLDDGRSSSPAADGAEPGVPEAVADGPSPGAGGTAPTSERAQPEPGRAAAETLDAFLQGYRDGDGNPSWEDHFVNVVVPCESTWNPYAVSDGGHLGLAQFT